MRTFLGSRTFEEYLQYRQQETLAGAVSFRTMAAAQRTTNPRVSPPELLTALLRENAHRFVYERDGYIEASFWDDGVFVTAALAKGNVSITVSAPDDRARERLAGVMARLDAFGPPPRDERGTWIRFTTRAEGCVSIRTRFTPCPSMDALRGNYAATTAAALARLADDPAPWEPGKILIWNGPSGTGKTHALRALLMAWQDRFDFYVVNDPVAFAATPSYYLDIHSRSGVDIDEEEGYTEAEDAKGEDRPKLFVFEDAADLVRVESRAERGDAMGKFLNLTDGLFGQGRRDLFLISFNEELAEIDPAFLRPGRCRGIIGFPALSRDESNAWMERHDLTPAAAGDMTLAELYRHKHRADRADDAASVAAEPSAPRIAPRERIGFVSRTNGREHHA